MSQIAGVERPSTERTHDRQLLWATILTTLAWVALIVGFIGAPIFAVIGLTLALLALGRRRHRGLSWGLVAANVMFLIFCFLLLLALIPTGEITTFSESVPVG